MVLFNIKFQIFPKLTNDFKPRGNKLNCFLSLATEISELEFLSLKVRTRISPWSYLGTDWELNKCAVSHRNILALRHEKEKQVCQEQRHCLPFPDKDDQSGCVFLSVENFAIPTQVREVLF